MCGVIVLVMGGPFGHLLLLSLLPSEVPTLTAPKSLLPLKLLITANSCIEILNASLSHPHVDSGRQIDAYTGVHALPLFLC